jgi:hypothetical protein
MAQRSLHVVTKVYYGLYVRIPGVVYRTTTPLAPCEPRRVTTPISHSSEQGTLPTTSLISKQAVPYWTRGGTCWPGVSTPKTWSLADSSMTNHKTWRSQPSPPFQTLLKLQHRTSPQSPHITTEGRPALSTLNTNQTQHHKDGKTCIILMIAGLSNTTNHKNTILKYESLGNQLMHEACVY